MRHQCEQPEHVRHKDDLDFEGFELWWFCHYWSPGAHNSDKWTEGLKGRVRRAMIQDRMRVRTNMRMVLKENLEADTETEGEGDEDDEPGEGGEEPAA